MMSRRTQLYRGLAFLATVVMVMAIVFGNETKASATTKTTTQDTQEDNQPYHTVCQEYPYGTETAPCSTVWANGYRIVRGETLWGLALRYYGKGSRWWDIARRNGISNPRRVRAGTVLYLPWP